VQFHRAAWERVRHGPHSVKSGNLMPSTLLHLIINTLSVWHRSEIKKMRISKLTGWICFVALLSTGNSEAASIVTNGDFETGSLGWTVDAGSDPTHPPIVIGYNNTFGFPNGAYGESVPTPINGLTSGAYFSADTAPQSISQTVALTATHPTCLALISMRRRTAETTCLTLHCLRPSTGRPSPRSFRQIASPMGGYITPRPSYPRLHLLTISHWISRATAIRQLTLSSITSVFKIMAA